MLDLVILGHSLTFPSNLSTPTCFICHCFSCLNSLYVCPPSDPLSFIHDLIIYMTSEHKSNLHLFLFCHVRTVTFLSFLPALPPLCFYFCDTQTNKRLNRQAHILNLLSFTDIDLHTLFSSPDNRFLSVSIHNICCASLQAPRPFSPSFLPFRPAGTYFFHNDERSLHN